MSDLCHYCEQPFSEHVAQRRTRDHVLPKIFGNLSAANLVDACRTCNQIKGNMTPAGLREQAVMLDQAAARLRCMADKVDALIVERRLLVGEP